MVGAIIDVEALRQFRSMNLNSNWIKDLRMELFKRMYEKPIHPKNLWLEEEPKHHAEVDEIYRSNIRKLQERGTYTAPCHDFEGAYCQSPATNEKEWKKLKKLWDDFPE
jgi:hypothetical protein